VAKAHTASAGLKQEAPEKQNAEDYYYRNDNDFDESHGRFLRK